MKLLNNCAIFATIMLMLSACSTPEQRAQRTEMIAQADHGECIELGFRPKTDAYGDCRLRLQEMRSNERAARLYPVIRYGVGSRGYHGSIGHRW